MSDDDGTVHHLIAADLQVGAGDLQKAKAMAKEAKRKAPRDDLPYKRACDLAEIVFPVSEAVILALARKYGVGRKMGRSIVFSNQDIERLYEVLPCPSGSSVVPDRRTGSSAAPSGESALKKALGLLTDGSPKRSGRSARAKSSKQASMVVALPVLSQRRR
jgi:hypothetical protein